MQQPLPFAPVVISRLCLALAAVAVRAANGVEAYVREAFALSQVHAVCKHPLCSVLILLGFSLERDVWLGLHARKWYMEVLGVRDPSRPCTCCDEAGRHEMYKDLAQNIVCGAVVFSSCV